MDQRTRQVPSAGRRTHTALLTDPYTGTTEILLERFFRLIRLLRCVERNSTGVRVNQS